MKKTAAPQRKAGFSGSEKAPFSHETAAPQRKAGFSGSKKTFCAARRPLTGTRSSSHSTASRAKSSRPACPASTTIITPMRQQTRTVLQHVGPNHLGLCSKARRARAPISTTATSTSPSATSPSPTPPFRSWVCPPGHSKSAHQLIQNTWGGDLEFESRGARRPG